VAAAAVFLSAALFMAALLAAVIIHELGHAFAARNFGISATRISIMPFGGSVDIDCGFLSARRKNIVLLAGPVANLFVAMLCGVMIWLFPVLFMCLEYLAAANFITGAMNLLPIYPLDGGKIISNYIAPKYILWASNFLFFVLLIFAVAVFNFLLIFFAAVMLVCINFEFKTTNYKSKFAQYQKTGKFVTVAVNSDQTLFSVYKAVDSRRPTQFIVVDRNNVAFYESDLEKWLLSNPIMTKISSVSA
jgi:Zn-dependent protease